MNHSVLASPSFDVVSADRASRFGPLHRARVVAVALLASVAMLGLPAPRATGVTPELGHAAGSTGGAGSAATGQKAESKLWSHAGIWWSVMANGTAHTIFRLDRPSNTWMDTGVVVDSRLASRADVLVSGTSVYIASHKIAASNTTGKDAPTYLRQFTYEAASASYQPTSAQVTIGTTPAEVLTIAQDSTGRLWATWVRQGAVLYSHSLASPMSWSAPQTLTVSGATSLPPDDISAIVSMGDRIGIMWSNQNAGLFGFAEHLDSAPPGAWSGGPAVQSPDIADDHLSLTTDPSSPGRVLAIVKTSMDLQGRPHDQMIELLERNPGTGAWTAHDVGTVADCHTRPTVAVDSRSSEVHVFLTAPTQDGCPYSGYPGTIYRKSAPLGTLTFATGRGVPVIRSSSSDDMNNVTVAKQAATTQSGLVILASSDTEARYWWTDVEGPAGPPADPAPTAGFTPALTVQFTSSAVGATSVLWDFGDGTTSTETSPQHVYAAPGDYTVTQTVTNASGSSTATSSITVAPVVVQP